MMNETTSLPLQTNSIYIVVVEDLDRHYQPSLSMYWILSNVVSFWILASYLFLPNDSLTSDNMVDWYNDSMLEIGGGDTNIDEG